MKRFVLLFLAAFLFSTVIAQTVTFTMTINNSSDDAEEKFDGSYLTLTSSDLELVYDTWNDQGNQTVGIRFPGVNIPPDATIVNAYIQFTADGATTTLTNLLIKGEKIANSLTFTNTINNISGRQKTTAEVNWGSIPSWVSLQAGVTQRTPNLSGVVTEIITNNAWQPGAPLTFIITGTGVRRAYSWDGNSARAPKLVIEYSGGTIAQGLFFAAGSEWKYKDDGSDQGTGFLALDIDDSGWNTGKGQFGYGEGDETTLINSGHITYYFRKKVHVYNHASLNDIYFYIVHDDGAVIYVNGVEVARSALIPQGLINNLTTTTAPIPVSERNDFWTYKVNKSYFRDGENIIAIEVHKHAASVTTLSFDCKVLNEMLIYKLDGPYVYYRDGKIIVKTIEARGPRQYIYTNPYEVNLVCRFPDGSKSFNVQLKPDLHIEPSLYELPQKFAAITDIEGNLEGFVLFLTGLGIMDNNFNWTFGNGHLFFVGDMFDRGDNVTECLWLLYRLESQAIAQGGKIHFVIGNHDIMNLIYDFRYVSAKYLHNVTLIGETLHSLYATDSELGRWLRTKNVIERAGSIIFVHGGISPDVATLNLSYDLMNHWGRFRMNQLCQTGACSTINGGSDVGLYWYRGMADHALTQVQVDNILQTFGGTRVIIGHTLFSNITLLYDKQVIAIDLNHNSNFQSGFMRGLYFENNKFYNFYTNGTTHTYTLLDDLTTGINSIELTEHRLNAKAYPNPATATITFEYFIPSEYIKEQKSSLVQLKVFDSAGKQVATLVNKLQSPGSHETTFSAAALQGGVYFYQITIGDLSSEMKKLVLIK